MANTLQLAILVLLVQFPIGILIGITIALRHRSRWSQILQGILLFFYSMPGFWLALLLIMVFAYQLGWLPASQMRSFTAGSTFWDQSVDRMRHLVLPVTVLSLPFIAYTARFVRTSMLEVLAQPYITTALAFGIDRKKVVFKYAFKNALLPLVTLVGIYLPFLLSGAVITESIFAWPGMGRLTVNAIFAYDYPVILAATLVAAIAVVVGNLVSDLLYCVVDPRIRQTRV
jgi:peptide/nickel transport system permease protein